MRSANKLAPALALAFLAGCGNYGNGPIIDSIYVNALPSDKQLAYVVPKDPSSPLCLLGQSKTAQDTHDLGVDLELEVQGILAIINFIKAQPPTAREQSSRTWGPWPDGQHAGIWDRVTMTRLSDTHFTFAIDQRQGTSGEFITILASDLLGADATHGSGALQFNYGASARLGTSKPTDPQSGFLEIDYDAGSDPRTIHLATTNVASPIDVKVAAYADGQASIALDYTTPTSKGTAHVVATSKFLGTGAGTAKVTLTAAQLGNTITECWDAVYCRSYFHDLAGWTNPPCTQAFCELGNVLSCPAVHGGPP